MSTATPYAKPLPEEDPEAKPYWQSAREHALKVQRCDDCTKWTFPPVPLCPHCLSEKLVWTPISGRGEVYASTTQYHPPYKGFTPEEMPINVSIIALEEGPHMVSNVIGSPVDQVRIGCKVEVVYDDVTDKVTLPKFKLRKS
ncbi:MAG: Zn-ribbon domain-containing OB-fold protein [Pseudorhodoplanes sp.]